MVKLNDTVTVNLTVEEVYALVDLCFDKRKSILDNMNARDKIATTEEWEQYESFKKLTSKLRHLY